MLIKRNFNFAKISIITKMFVDIYEAAPEHSPVKFLAFIDNFFLIMNRKQNIVEDRLKRLKVYNTTKI